MFEREKEKLMADGMHLRNYSDKKRNNKELVMVAVNQNGGALEFASPELQGDKEIVSKAVEQNGSALDYAK